MTDAVFVDTNVLVYVEDQTEPEKQARAEAWLSSLWTSGAGRVSVQILNELYSVLTRKLKPGLPRAEARHRVRLLRAWEPQQLDEAVLERAFDLEDRFALSWWDALVIAAAQEQGCRWILSEDLQAGQVFDGVEVLSPFTTDPNAWPPRPLRAHDGP